ncbi:MAG: phytoene/squalene synthase family protein [Acidobacteriota bacterium]
MSGPRAGSSFTLAARLLPADVARDAVTLYGFCRRVDDLADLATDPAAARRHLRAVRQALATGDSQSEAEILELIDRRQVPITSLLHLVDAVESDLGSVRIADLDELLAYCHGVAGTVGEAMCAVLETRSPRALEPARELGIAMQLTNIARDVVEDAERGRRYLPRTLLGADLEPADLAGRDATVASVAAAREAAWPAVLGLLGRAEHFYRRADQGLRFIPWRSRPAILIAARTYEEIGRCLRARGPQRYWQSRCALSTADRCRAVGRAALALPSFGLSDRRGAARTAERPRKPIAGPATR